MESSRDVVGNDSIRHGGPKPRGCGCKGIRSCRFCEAVIAEFLETSESQPNGHHEVPKTEFEYCIVCGMAWKVIDPNLQAIVSLKDIHTTEPQSEGNHKNIRAPNCSETQTFTHANNKPEISDICSNQLHDSRCEADFRTRIPQSQTACSHQNSEPLKDFEGIVVLENFVTGEEEQHLVSTINETQFVNSQSGRRKQDYGPKVNFKKKKLRTTSFSGLPSYSRFLYERMKSHPSLHDFKPVELCNLEYCQERGAHIDPHFDDAWLWGERLVTLNLLSHSTLTFSLDSHPEQEVRVPLPRRSLIIVFSAARYKWKHSIHSKDIGDSRIAMTFRELSSEFNSGGDREQEGSDLLDLALKFQGHVVST